MPNRRRYHRDQPHPTASFTWGHLVNLAAIPLVTAIIMLTGWYFLTSDTLRRHSEELKQVQNDKKDEREARDRVRNEFLEGQRKNNEGLSKLDTRLAVAEKQQETANQLLGKLVDTIQRATPPARGR